MGQLDLALGYFKKALAIKEVALGKEHPSIATTYHNIAYVYWKQGDRVTAREYLEKALDIRLEKLGKEHPRTKDTQKALAELHEEMQ